MLWDCLFFQIWCLDLIQFQSNLQWVFLEHYKMISHFISGGTHPRCVGRLWDMPQCPPPAGDGQGGKRALWAGHQWAVQPLLGSAPHPPPELTADPVWQSPQDTIKTREDVGSSAALSDPWTRPRGPAMNLDVGEHGPGVQCGRGSPQQQMLGKPASYLGEIQLGSRSEERRVGKECRSRWSPYH